VTGQKNFSPFQRLLKMNVEVREAAVPPQIRADEGRKEQQEFK
jgi:hypothetical protein